jgi:hypothetical protein
MMIIMRETSKKRKMTNLKNNQNLPKIHPLKKMARTLTKK